MTRYGWAELDPRLNGGRRAPGGGAPCAGERIVLGALLGLVVLGDDDDEARAGVLDAVEARLHAQAVLLGQPVGRRLLAGAGPVVDGALRDPAVGVAGRVGDRPAAVAEVRRGPRGQPLDGAV